MSVAASNNSEVVDEEPPSSTARDGSSATNHETSSPSIATTDDDPHYRVIPPHDGAEPDEIQYTEDGVTHRYWDLRGYESRSRFAPDVLLYANHETVVV